jgi:hypothetical protein
MTMTHRVIAAFVVALCVATTAKAQRSHIGIKAGPTAATMNGSYITSKSGLELGWSFLLTLDAEFGKNWGVEAGAGWYQKGGNKLQLADQPEGETTGYQTSYLAVPITGRYKFRFSTFSLAAYTGIKVGWGSSCQVKPGNQFEFDESCEESTPGGTLESLEFAIPFGLAWSIEFPGGSRFTIVDVGYHLGLTNTLSAAKAAGQTAKNGVWVFQFGFAIPLYDSSND